ncbi:MAG: glycosyltransferase, exosortase A system-associated [Burkholderiaceae bacterium]|nr:glycosyltransferase, exosortase A system-associated [Burkholderiaceae bacterium]
MRILHVLDHSAPLHSGYVFRTLAILREQRRCGWETFQLTGPKQNAGDLERESSAGFEFLRTPYTPGLLARLPALWPLDQMRATEARLMQLARELEPEILHAHSPVLDAWPAIRVGRALGIPVVYEVRALWEDAAVDHGTASSESLRYRASRAMETRAFRQADAITTICEGLRRDILKRGIAGHKVTVIPNAVDIERFPVLQGADVELQHVLGLAGCDVVGFCGSFYGYEGLDLLIDALPRIVASRPATKLLLVGGGPQDAALREQARARGLADRVVFTGRVPNTEINRYYGLIDVLAFPRHSMRLTELVTPLKPLEAMAQGRVLVASDVGGHRELIEHQGTGLLFRAGDAQALAQSILRLLDDAALRERLATAGRRFVDARRTWARSVEGYRSIYAALAARRVRA